MTQKIDEQLSAFLDGELPPHELDLLLARLDRDSGRRSALARYAMIGETIRTGAGRVEALSIAEHVRLQLDREEAERAASAPAPRAPGRGWITGAVAAAAAVAAVLVGVPYALQGPQVVAVAPPEVAAVQEPQLLDITPAATRRLTPRAAARLTGYLVAHGQYANQLSRNAFDSHLVSARAERASWRLPQDPQRAR